MESHFVRNSEDRFVVTRPNFSLTLYLLGIFSSFLSSADYFQIYVFKKKYCKVANILGSDQARHFVRLDLGQN